MRETRRLVLASASGARKAMLKAAGIDVAVVASGVDERALERQRRHASPSETAAMLAREKALAVSRAEGSVMVIGADQILDDQVGMIAKATSIEEARQVLLRLRGRVHRLHSACALAEGGAVVWEGSQTVELEMRNFSDAFLDSYLAAEGEGVMDSVGAYKIEGRGLQLFDAIAGDHFAILGLPLLPLLDALRARGVLAT